MGKLIDGRWQDVSYSTAQSNGRFVRKDASFRSWVTRDGAAGPSGEGGFAAGNAGSQDNVWTQRRRGIDSGDRHLRQH